MIASIALGVAVALVLLDLYFAYHRFIHGNPFPLSTLSVRNRANRRHSRHIDAHLGGDAEGGSDRRRDRLFSYLVALITWF